MEHQDTISPRHISVTETAKLIRAILKRKFPGVKFSVRSSSYAGGASITVRWTDGPTDEAVNKVIAPFAGADFDGMIDLKYYTTSWLLPTGEAVPATSPGTTGSAGADPEYWNAPPCPDAELVDFGADFVFTNRQLSPELRAKLARKVCEKYGLDFAELENHQEGLECAINQKRVEHSNGLREWLSTLIYRESRKTE